MIFDRKWGNNKTEYVFLMTKSCVFISLDESVILLNTSHTCIEILKMLQKVHHMTLKRQIKLAIGF